MLMSFRCPPHLKERIDTLIREGLYPDFSSFVIAALQNQLLLEESQTGGPTRKPAETSTATASSAAESPGVKPIHVEPPRADESDFERRFKHQRPRINRLFGREPSPDAAASPELPDLLRRERLDAEPPVRLPPVAPDILPPDQIVPINRWLFGQYNRLVPAKVSLRARAVLVSEAGDARPLGEAAAQIAEAAAQFGERLRLLDQQFTQHRDEALATAFPEPGSAGQKGRLRYQNHFVAHVIRKEAGGLPTDLKLATIEWRKERPWLLPTAPGWEFARLPNPLLDEPVGGSRPDRFSAEEVGFLLHHLRERVPAELFAYRAVLTLIHRGATTPDDLTAGLTPYLPPGWSLNAEKDFISTQRTGAIARAADLGLVVRQRQARHVTYHLTSEGGRFLAEVGEAPSNGHKAGPRRNRKPNSK